MGRNGQFGLSPRHGNRADRFLAGKAGIVGWASLVLAQLSYQDAEIMRVLGVLTLIAQWTRKTQGAGVTRST
jgi:hypothetical protein